MRTRLAIVATVLAAVAAPAFVGQTWSAFTGTTDNTGSSLAAQRIFPGTRTTTAWKVREYATATPTNRDDPLAFAGDARTSIGNALPTAYSATKYVEVKLETDLPSGLAITSPTLLLNLARASGTGTLRFFVEIRRQSTGAVLGTHGSSTAPLGTTTTTTQTPFSVALPEVATSAVAADLAVRVYAWDTAGGQLSIDRFQVDGSTPHSTFTLFESSVIQAFGATPITYPYALTATDTTYVTTGTWGTGFLATRYLSLNFEPDVPAGATVTSVTLTHAFRTTAGAAGTECVYYEARSGTTVIGSSFGGFTSTAPSCATTTFKTDVVTLTGVDTAAKVNGLEVRIYGKHTASRASDHDRALLAVTYSLD